MSNAAHVKPMTYEEFDEWHQAQVERYELVDGYPQLKFTCWDGARMMTGASNGHSLIAGNVYAACRAGLRGKPCRAFVADGKVRIPRGNVRYPDVSIDCGVFDRKATFLANQWRLSRCCPRARIGSTRTASSPSIKACPPCSTFCFSRKTKCVGRIGRAGEAGWVVENLNGPEAIVDLAAAGVRFTFADAYEGALDD